MFMPTTVHIPDPLLKSVDRDTSAAVDELLVAVAHAGRSKEPRDL
jgi:hypothetical protein